MAEPDQAATVASEERARRDAEWNEMYRDHDGYTKVKLFGSDLFGYFAHCCDRCGALVQNFTAHEAWHQAGDERV